MNYVNGDENVQMVDQTRLKLKQFYLAFILLFIGYFLAILQFIREWLTFFHAQRHVHMQ